MNPLFYENTTVIDCVENESFKAEILELKALRGAKDINLAGEIFLAKEGGITLKQVKITLKDSSFTTESGALYFMKGHIEAKNKMGGATGLMKKAFKNYLTQESTFKPTYTGSGEIFLEPSFGHYMFVELHDETIVVDKGLFLGCEPTLDISVAMQKNLSSGFLGGEGWFQTKISGTGLCILQIPVPREEVLVTQLQNEKLQVDGNFALLRRGDIRFSVQKSTKGLIGTFTSGEGLLQTFEGTGEVWLAPTQPIYRRLEESSFSQLLESKNQSNDTGNKK
ncbi:AIM24 family protein [Bacillus testis]|uniref:AIM24 family protein n=1 Tax=Bacillus testis TaxID=1622072 RepID=UPI00067EF192|nr:AIM24 family protein [Bacillus testis]